MAALPGEPSPIGHISQKGLVLLSVSPVMALLSSVCVVLRFLSRWLASSIQSDDWVCLVSLLFAYGATIGSMLSVTIGHAGYHLQEYTTPVLATFMKLNLTCMVVCYVSITLTKTSILLFYQRLFALHKNLLRAIWVLHVLVLAFLVTAVCCLVLAAVPIEATWKPWIPHRPVIGNGNALGYSLGAINSGLDFTLLLLPQRAVWTMRMSRRRKMLVSGVFLLGAIVCGVTIARLITIALVMTPNMADLTYTLIFPLMLSLIEMNVSIICACLPMFPSLFRHWRSKFATESTSNSLSSSRPLTVSFLRHHRRRRRLRDQEEAGAVEDSMDELNTNTRTDPEYQGASYYMMKPARVHVAALESWDSMTGSQSMSR